MRKDWIARALLGFMLAMGITMLIFLCLLSGGCSRKVYVPVETIKTEYRDHGQKNLLVDSVFLRDSVTVFILGDTVYVDRWRDRVKWRDREVRDTIQIIKADTIQIPYPVERQLGRWEKAKMDFGVFGMIIGIAGISIIIIWLAKKFKR